MQSHGWWHGDYPPNVKTLYLIDGYAQFFRAYHAIRTPMTSTVTNEPTNLTFGFVGMLLKLLREDGKIAEHGSHADYIALALDVSGDRGTFRSQIYPEYKATRPAGGIGYGCGPPRLRFGLVMVAAGGLE